MMACVYDGKKDLSMKQVPVPLVSDPEDAIIKITATTICGSDLHLYHGEVPKNQMKGYILGHEAVGIVDDVGSEVKNFKKGDRVVVSPIVACGKCEFCQRGEFSCCDVTNVSQLEREMYGHNTSGILGYSALMGAYDGCQTEYVRVPFADVNLFRIPEGVEDKKALMVSDIACTGFHGNELAGVKEGDNVVVFGCGPVGIMTIMWAVYRKAKMVIAVDIDEQRLKFVEQKFKVKTINSSKVDPIIEIKNLLPRGPEKIIDCVGFRFPETFIHKFQRAIGLETDSPNILNTMIQICKKNGKIALIGDYLSYTNHFNIGGFMEKHLSMSGGQLWPHKYQEQILNLIKNGEFDPSIVITHTFPLSKCAEVYKMFDKHEGGIIKCVLIPDALTSEHIQS
jgi:threonine dehydrogenase-like Zn-dependent dehydrogenase